MSFFKLISCSSFLLLFLACGGTDSPSSLFEIEIKEDRGVFHTQEEVVVELANKKDKEILDVQYSLDGKVLPAADNTIRLDTDKLGNRKLVAKVTFEGGEAEINKNILLLAKDAPKIYTYEIVNTYPHQKSSFTQGLEFHNDTLYEGTGKKGSSALMKIDYSSGEVLDRIDLNENYFGEGITIMGNTIYQLTWQSGLGFTYNLDTFEKTGSFKYGKSKEGWGLCNDGQKIYKSDGTEKIWILDPTTLTEKDYIQTVTNKSVFNKANELEYVEGKIYANVWQKESMMIIDPVSGAIEGVINFGGLKEKVGKHPQLDVLNGVAYHPGRKTLFVTGKYWDKIFEVKIKPKN
ncbi:glutaminyl-peptide cyclotransferase [Zeaxanthinibacter sp. PT1]|uniref:glutaminyl-peptide cyclotransferase n=1 Tax=Zeaxanthinibacter TaxID=561554 RepID=UPI002348EEF4|nr:glutaminyl-peptide cyclotransferase [Zeaxanthinibacter sp. PT1]MDC6351708.1 glutaminyl-peptide cyclotransferase [Zeaxanthinibacter sp. PT1]